MWQVEYGYYNYPRLTKSFSNYQSAKKFFYFIMKKNGVKRVALVESAVDTAEV